MDRKKAKKHLLKETGLNVSNDIADAFCNVYKHGICEVEFDDGSKSCKAKAVINEICYHIGGQFIRDGHYVGYWISNDIAVVPIV